MIKTTYTNQTNISLTLTQENSIQQVLKKTLWAKLEEGFFGVYLGDFGLLCVGARDFLGLFFLSGFCSPCLQICPFGELVACPTSCNCLLLVFILRTFSSKSVVLHALLQCFTTFPIMCFGFLSILKHVIMLYHFLYFEFYMLRYV